MKQSSDQRFRIIPSQDGVGDGIRTSETPHLLPADFDNTIELLLTEMTDPEMEAKKKMLPDHYILAALLLQGAYPVMH